MVTLLDELIEEILLKLPVKSLLRFKCVCKSWFSLISDPQFAKLHFDLAVAAPTDRLLLKFYSEKEAKSALIEASLYDDSEEIVFNFPDPSPVPNYRYRVYVVGSCRGFLLLATASYDIIYFVIWNPTTGSQKLLNKVFYSVSEFIYDPYQYQYLCGIGYDSSTDDYVVVTITFSLPQKLHCFSSRKNSWYCIEGIVPYKPHNGDIDRVGHGSFLNGAIHWLVESYDNLYVIISFDVMEWRLSEIPLPHDVAVGEQNKLNYLRVMGGCLCICLPGYWTPGAEVWMMKEYKVQSSWTKLLVISTDYAPPLFPICLTKNGEIFVCDGCEILMRFDDKGKLLEDYANEACNIYDVPNCVMYRESLLSLPEDLRN